LCADLLADLPLLLMGILADRKFTLFGLIISSFSLVELIDVLRLSKDGFLLKLIVGVLANVTPVVTGGIPGVVDETNVAAFFCSTISSAKPPHFNLYLPWRHLTVGLAAALQNK